MTLEVISCVGVTSGVVVSDDVVSPDAFVNSDVVVSSGVEVFLGKVEVDKGFVGVVVTTGDDFNVVDFSEVGSAVEVSPSEVGLPSAVVDCPSTVVSSGGAVFFVEYGEE